MIYEHRKHSGELPIIGVNTFEEGIDNSLSIEEFDIEVTRSDKEERMMVIDRNRAFKETHAKEAEEGLARLKQVAREGGNLFEVMMNIVEYCTVGQVTQALFETGGKFRRNM
jgi:methylmalonyl-CoA mutase